MYSTGIKICCLLIELANSWRYPLHDCFNIYNAGTSMNATKPREPPMASLTSHARMIQILKETFQHLSALTQRVAIGECTPPPPPLSLSLSLSLSPHIYLFVYLSIYLSILSISLSVCLSICLSIYLSFSLEQILGVATCECNIPVVEEKTSLIMMMLLK